jgi:hypothetical protein
MPFDIAGKVTGPSVWPEFNLVDANEISALDQKRTLPHVLGDVGFAPKSRH